MKLSVLLLLFIISVVSAAITVYDDGLNPDFQPVGVYYDYPATVEQYPYITIHGSSSLRASWPISTTPSWPTRSTITLGQNLNCNYPTICPLDPTTFDYIDFWVKFPKIDRYSIFTVGLGWPSYIISSVDVRQFSPLYPNSWTHVRIPVTALPRIGEYGGGSGRLNISAIQFKYEEINGQPIHATELLLDSVYLLKSGESNPCLFPASVPIFEDEIANPGFTLSAAPAGDASENEVRTMCKKKSLSWRTAGEVSSVLNFTCPGGESCIRFDLYSKIEFWMYSTTANPSISVILGTNSLSLFSFATVPANTWTRVVIDFRTKLPFFSSNPNQAFSGIRFQYSNTKKTQQMYLDAMYLLRNETDIPCQGGGTGFLKDMVIYDDYVHPGFTFDYGNVPQGMTVSHTAKKYCGNSSMYWTPSRTIGNMFGFHSDNLIDASLYSHISFWVNFPNNDFQDFGISVHKNGVFYTYYPPSPFPLVVNSWIQILVPLNYFIQTYPILAQDMTIETLYFRYYSPNPGAVFIDSVSLLPSGINNICPPPPPTPCNPNPPTNSGRGSTSGVDMKRSETRIPPPCPT